MHLVVAYDVVDNGRRTRLMKALKGFLPHVQKSVFEGELDEPQILKLREQIRDIIDHTEDSVRIYRLCRRCVPVTEIIGLGVYIEPEEDLVI